jgi:hypothetical protein
MRLGTRLCVPNRLAPLGVCWALSSGCSAALMPGVPAGPIATPGIRAGTSYSFAYAPSTAQAVDPGAANFTVDANSAMLDGRSLSPLPAGLALRLAPRSWLDLGVDLGFRESGLQVRAGQLDASRAVPWGVELEWRTGLGAFVRDSLVHRRNILRLRAEAYPALDSGGPNSGPAYSFGVLALGVSTGTQLLTVNEVPDEYNDSYFLSSLNVASLDALHWETRLEPAIGLHWLRQPGAYTLVFLPWWRLQQGATLDTDCRSCTLRVLGIESSWGFGLALSGSWQARSWQAP